MHTYYAGSSGVLVHNGCGDKAADAAEEGAGAADDVDTALVPGRTFTGHASKQMAERGISRKMVDAAIRKGTRYYDRKDRTFSHVLEGGFASGWSLTAATDPLTGNVVTAIRRSRPFNPATRLPDGRLGDLRAPRR